MASSIRRLLLPSSSHHHLRVIRIDGCVLFCKDGKSSKKLIKHNWEIALIVIGCALFSLLMIFMIVKYIRRRNSNINASRTRNLNDNPPILFNTQEDFIDEEQGPQLDHPIWYIRTVGLDRSVVESITVFKYKAGEGLIEGTECSVCLGDFEDDESLRLLPKCSHAFHVQCIDTWLQSHKNCPLCRAPIVRAIGSEQAILEVPVTVGSSSNGPEEEALDNLHDRDISAADIDLSGTQIEDVVADDDGIRDSNMGSSRIEDAGKLQDLLDPLKSLRVVSDLGDHCRIMSKEIKRGRRSCSMDSPTAAEIYHAIGIATCNRARASSKRHSLEMSNSSLSTN